MREKLAIIFAIILVCGLSQAQKPKPLSKDELNFFIQQELESKRREVSLWRDKFVVEHDQRVIAEAQLSKLKAELFRLSK